MNSDLQKRIAAIKAECEEMLRRDLEMGEPAEWKPIVGQVIDRHNELIAQCDFSSTAAFIAHSRNISPKMARVVLGAIKMYETAAAIWASPEGLAAAMYLEEIANQWEGK